MWNYVIAGVLAGIVSIALTSASVLLPTWNRYEVKLGAIARLIICATSAWLWDHDLSHAFVVAVVVGVVVGYVRRLTAALTNATGQSPNIKRLEQLHRDLAIARQNAAFFAPHEVPEMVQRLIAEHEKAIEELESKVEPWNY